ncbi:dienelactone hydrolase family protein [Paenibacillus aurantius]|uniref:Dienelactone hydrolase family protein n=1 Tax=Paenibacillus aurantius TaxID=2918900 RepID=A0AA96LBF5_9BACL|nr:dienelactone hydrolase family protein [Paenibacillus aurantius]WNQ10596.1 dienelactone hydrolase family protein [Paenibacillus aurantius]
MPITSEWLTYEDGGQVHRMYVSRPANVKEPLPAVLVLQEVWGVSAHIRDVTDRFAKAGYVAAAPDLYAENGERPELLSDERIERVRTFLHSAPPQAFRDPAVREAALAERPEAERRLVQPSADALLAMPGRLPELVERTRAAYRFLQRYEPANGRTAAVGYCLGGALSARLAAAEPELAGAVVYYGRLAGELAEGIRCPVLGFFGGLDAGINALVPDFARAMEEQGKAFTSHMYDGAKHAFFNDTGAGYSVEASRDSWVRTLAFLRDTLA